MKVAVGISGGVDSAVAALILKEAGHEVVGVTMTLGRADEEKSLAEARAAADWLGVPLHVLDLAEVWQREVLLSAAETYRAGQTPNPCVRCNERVKLNLLPRWAFGTLGCDIFATGHYARLDHGRLLRGVDHAKDQSYFLYRAPQDVLQRTLFPLGSMTKAQVRARAAAAGFPVATRTDSQDFCGGDPRLLLGDRPLGCGDRPLGCGDRPLTCGDRPPACGDRPLGCGDRPPACGDRPLGCGDRPQMGEIVTREGKVIGHHAGYWHYTVGQRKGLGVGGGTPYYVISLDSAQNRVIVGEKAQSVRHYFRVCDVVHVGTDPYSVGTGPSANVGTDPSANVGTDPYSVGTDPSANVGTGPLVVGTDPLYVKVRSAGEPKGPVSFDGTTCTCSAGIGGVAPGQSAVFYRGDEIICGGIIS